MSNKNNIVIIDPAINRPVYESFNFISLITNSKVTYYMPALFGSESLDSIEDMKGLIILGSAASVHDNFNWQLKIIKVLEYAIENKIPVLGICYGHQLIAHIYGGRIEKLWGGEKKKGVRKVRLFHKPFNNISNYTNLVYTHNEGVTDCPTDFEILASSKMCAIDGIISKSRLIYGFQPHIEATKQFFIEENIITNQDTLVISTNKEILLKFIGLIK